MRCRLIRLVTIVAAVVASSGASTASAATTGYSLTADYDASTPGVIHFTATQPLCASGSFSAQWQSQTLGSVRAPVVDVFSGHTNNIAWNHIPIGRFWGSDVYVCSDGSGTFTIDWQGVGRIFEGSGVFGTFRLHDGTGTYAGLSGTGSIFLIVWPAGGPHMELSGSIVRAA